MVPQPPGPLSRLGRIAALGAVLVAFVLRVLDLGGPSLWYDEGFAVQTARLPLPDLVARLIREDNHSPLHYLVLHVWMLLSGDSETALRFTSVVVGVLMVALTYAIFREIVHGRPQSGIAALVAGAPAAWLVALSPFLVYYAREARMYSLLACFTLAAAWTLLMATRRTLAQNTNATPVIASGAKQSPALASESQAGESGLSPTVGLLRQQGRSTAPAPQDIVLLAMTAGRVIASEREAIPRPDEGRASPAKAALSPTVRLLRRPIVLLAMTLRRPVVPPLWESSSLPLRLCASALPNPIWLLRNVTLGVMPRDEASGPPPSRPLLRRGDIRGSSSLPLRLGVSALPTPIWLAHGALMALMLYTQYMGVFFIPAFALFALLSGRRVFVRWLLAALVGALLFLPWLPFAVLQMRRLFGSTPEYFPAYLDASAVIQNGLRSFLALDTPTLAGAAALLLLAGSVALLVRDARRDPTLAKREALPMLAAWLPLLLIAVASSAIAKFVARYAIPAAPMLTLSISLVLFGLLWRKAIALRVVYAVAVAALLVFLGRGGWSATTTPWVPHEDARGIAEYLNERARPEQDIIFMDARPDAFDYYYHGQAAVHPMYVGFDFAAGADQLNAILSRQPERIWLVLWQHEAADPTGMVIDELQRRSAQGRVTRSAYREYTLLRFDLADWSPVAPVPTPQRPVGATFGGRLTLVGVDRLKDDPGTLRWILYWQAQQPLAGDLAVTLQLTDAAGAVRVSRSQGPSAPWLAAAGLPVGVTVRSLTEVGLPKDLPPGTYTASVLVWDPAAGRNLDAVGSDGAALGTRVALGTVDITPALLPK